MPDEADRTVRDHPEHGHSGGGADGGDDLREDGGQGDTVYFHFQDEYKEQIKDGVEEGGDNEEDQRTAGIPDGTQNAASHVVEKNAADAGKIDGQVGFGFLPYIRGCLHETEHGIDDQKAGQRCQKAENKGDRNGGVNGFAQSVLIVRAVPLGDDDRGTGGQTGAETNDGIDNGARGTDSGLRFPGDEIPDDQRVHRVVQLLEKQPDGHWNGKFNQVLPDAALCHVGIGVS